jgi:hypothetical protein
MTDVQAAENGHAEPLEPLAQNAGQRPPTFLLPLPLHLKTEHEPGSQRPRTVETILKWS